MKIGKIAGLLAGALLATAGMAPLAHAGQQSQLTKMTFFEPVEIPGVVLTPGTYYFSRIDNGNDPNVNLIQVYNFAEQPLDIFLQTVSVDRPNISARTVLTFSKSSRGTPIRLVDWFYPGTLTGHEFIYSPRLERQIDESEQITVAANRRGDTPVYNANWTS
ncbi:MAG TPA: hypothetical protein VMJ93_03815 [Verrucomicrobiae bacterium]|nr:hypothetical protein [Verrucomicrobiae bacterium]